MLVSILHLNFHTFPSNVCLFHSLTNKKSLLDKIPTRLLSVSVGTTGITLVPTVFHARSRVFMYDDVVV
ncbi:hypothetical protein CW304_14935 [Bacillus sp. UFRGS-B20]|nr:hypothetical protein CW304_14935 [Bacillus sp. UFRGS-B20]